MKINNAFLMICHKNEAQIIQLANILLEEPTNYLFILCDQNYRIKQKNWILSKLSNRIQILNSTFKIHWGEFSMVWATLILLEKALNFKIKFKYFHLISGQDFPIKPIHEITEFFKKNNKIYLDHFTIPRTDNNWGKDGGLGRYLTNNSNKNHLPLNIKVLYGGSQWWSLTNESVQYIFKYLADNPNYIKFYSTTSIPDESFFQTILLNSDRYKTKIVNNNLRYIDWTRGPSFPRILEQEDFKRIIDSDAILARKFDSHQSIEILKLIEIYIKQ